jgi:hypothetical protein
MKYCPWCAPVVETAVREAGAKVREAGAEVSASYDRDDDPLGGYLGIMAVYATLVGGAGYLLHRSGRLPESFGTKDVLLLATATHKLSRTVSKDSVASPLRAPFTRFEGPAAPGEVHEKVRGTGVRKSIGELITCPFCLDQWVATGFVAGLAVAPRFTRFVATTFAARAGADFLQFGYDAAQRLAERGAKDG